MTWVENPHHASTVYNNPNPSPCLQIHPVVIETEIDGEGPNNGGRSNHEGEGFSDLDLDEVSDDINDEGMKDDENVYALSIGNSTRDIVKLNDPMANMLSVDMVQHIHHKQ